LEARQTVHAAERDSLVQTHAPLELKKALDTLARADALQLKGEVGSEIDSVAYVASQQARTAVAVALAKGNEAAVVGAEAERQRARADRRTVELESARTQTGVARQQTAAAEQVTAMAITAAGDARAESAQAQAQNAQLQQRLAELQAQKTERGMLVTLGDVLFELNRAEVKPAAQVSLRKLAEFMQQYPTRQVLIEGHTDNTGAAALNVALSTRRAEAVRAALLSHGSAADAPRITAVGYGEQYPVADNATVSNRALNRRVEVYIADNDQPVRPRR
jgi:outer membrane protein OmpA-like peptidoglycan-associated protein